jgi:hypothetical protein
MITNTPLFRRSSFGDLSGPSQVDFENHRGIAVFGVFEKDFGMRLHTFAKNKMECHFVTGL